MWLVPALSEGVLGSQLNQTGWVDRAVDLPERRRTGAADERRLTEGRMVQDVEGFHAEVQRVSFRQLEMLGQGQVPVLLEWPSESVARRVAEEPWIGFETAGIQET